MYTVYSWLGIDIEIEMSEEFNDIPSSRSLMSLAAWIPSSLRFFSICLLRARAARSSADMAQPILLHVAFTNATLTHFLSHQRLLNGAAR